MTTDIKTIKCFSCDVPLKGPAEPKSEDTIWCPICGENDTLDNVLAEVKAFAVEATAKRLNEGLERAARSSRVMKKTNKK
jgi:hypothetical protein